MKAVEDSIARELRSRDPDVVVAALKRVGFVGLDTHAETVLQLMKESRNPLIKNRCAWAIGRLCYQESYADLIANLKHNSADVRIWSAWALGELDLEKAVPHMRKALAEENHPKVQQALGGGLKKLAGLRTRVHRSQIDRALRVPKSSDPIIAGIVQKLEAYTWPEDADEILKLRSQLRDADPDYFSEYMSWIKRKPALLNAAQDSSKVFD
ncbi:MAG: HEAT repeat domain-containing protein [Dehalococcoidia bacterium]